VRPDLPTGTVTFVFTDVEGSTSLLNELGAEGYAAALADHRTVIREACIRDGGVEVDTQGDAFFFAGSRSRSPFIGGSRVQIPFRSSHANLLAIPVWCSI
jgi:class 3 adenylate cyclase